MKQLNALINILTQKLQAYRSGQLGRPILWTVSTSSPPSADNKNKRVMLDTAYLLPAHCTVLPPGTFNGAIQEPLPIMLQVLWRR